jgi:hypothetical protein
MITLTEAHRLALSLPAATEDDQHGMRSFRVANKPLRLVAVPPERGAS